MEPSRWSNFDTEELILLIKGVRMSVTRDTNIPVTPREFFGYCKLIAEVQEECTARIEVNQRAREEQTKVEEPDPNAGSE